LIDDHESYCANEIENIAVGVKNCRTTETADELCFRMEMFQQELQKTYETLEESKAIIQAYKQALTGDYETDSPEDVPPARPDPMAIVGELKNLAESLKKKDANS
jgi:DNA/RNA-binding domain of Phe-tRNA-synthetase-like protein